MGDLVKLAELHQRLSERVYGLRERMRQHLPGPVPSHLDRENKRLTAYLLRIGNVLAHQVAAMPADPVDPATAPRLQLVRESA